MKLSFKNNIPLGLVITVALVSGLSFQRADAHTNPVVDQTNFHFYEDNGGANAATGYGGVAQDTNITGVPSNGQLRLRIGWGETAGGDAKNTDPTLWYSTDAAGNCANGTWTQLTTNIPLNGWYMYNSPNFTDGAASTQRVTTGTFTAGEVRDTTAQATRMNLSNSKSEHEWTLQAVGVTGGQTYYFRFQNANSAIESYTACPSLTINSPPLPPSNSSPSDGATGVDVNPTLTAGSYTDTDGDAHADTEWRVDDDSGFGSPVWTRTAGSAETSTTLNSTNGTFANELSGQTNLDYGTQYYWQVRYSDGAGWSGWSLATSFTTAQPTFTQSAYRWFANANSTDVGTALASQDAAATLSSSGLAFRLRMLLHVGTVSLAQSGQNFKLQFAAKGGGTCASPTGSYLDVAASASDPAWNLSFASYDNISKSAPEGFPSAVAFKSDGTKMYVLGTNSTPKVYEHSLSTAWDVSTASYNNASTTVSESSAALGLAFKSDGTKMYVVFNGDDTVKQYSLSTAWDITSASYDTVSFSVNEDTVPTGASFKSDGTKMYVVGNTNDAVYQYSLSTAWDLGIVSYDNVSGGLTEVPVATDVFFKPDGTKMYVVGSNNDAVFQYSVPTAWDLTNTSYDNTSHSIGSEEPSPGGLAFKSDGTKMYVVGSTNDAVFQYSLSSDIIFNNNATPTDGSALTIDNGDNPTHSTDTVRSQTYEEANNFTNSSSAIAAGEDGLWDFALIDNGAPANTTYCFRAVESDGTALSTYSQYPEITTAAAGNSLPVASSVSIDSGAASVTLTEGTTTNVSCVGTVTDADGFADITSVKADFFRTSVGIGSALDDNDHYQLSGDTECVPSGGSGNSETYTCTFAVQYFADPTDASSPNAADNWTCTMTPSDGAGEGTAASDTVEMNSTVALSVTASINYGTLDPNSDSGATNQTTTITNTGNRDMDPQISGVNMTSGGNSIPVSQQKYSDAAFTYSGGGTALSGSATTINLTLPQRTGVEVTDDLFWGLGVPGGTLPGTYTGTNTFTATEGI